MRYIFSTIIAAFFCLGTAQAAPTVEERVNELTKQLKETHSYSVLADYVHWPSVWETIPESRRSELQMKNPEDLKNRIKGVMSNPEALLLQDWKKLEVTLTPQQREILKPHFDKKIAETKEAWVSYNSELAESNFKIAKKEIKAEKGKQIAMIRLEDAENSATKPWNLNFQLIEGNWFLPSLELGEGKGISSLLSLQ